MMSKAAYMMQENLRHSYSLIVDLRQPISFCVRGRLPYPSGLLAVSTLFRNCKPADVYAHKYFIEKQSNPSQPSPQMHITEESQSIMKVISGLRYMKDDNSKLDNTMYICTDFDIPADGRMLQCMKDLKKERELQSRLEKVEEAKAEQTVVPEKGTDDVVAKRYQSRLDAFVEQLTNESKAVGSMRKEKEPQTLKQLLKSARGKAKTDDDEEYDYASDSSAANGPPSLRSVIGSGSTTFPSAADAMEQSNVYRFFEEANRISQKADKTNTGAFMDNVEGSLGREPPTIHQVKGGYYTVLYNPVETNEITFIDVIRKLSAQRGVVRAIVVPTRDGLDHLQPWADAFPDATIYTAGEVPSAAESARMEERDGPRTYGLRDMGGGVLGMEFPDFDAEAEQKQTESVQEEEQRLREEMRAAVRLAQRGEEEKDPADVLWEDPSTLREPGADLKRYLRPSDLHRVQLLDAVLAANPSPDNAVLLTPDIELLQVAGDAVANEYVLYDKKSKVLACRELFHGVYSDLDPVNTWFCRVWFKFMKKGNYKRTDIIPRSKYWQLMRQDGLQTTQRWVDWLTRNREIHSLVFAHGTPPATGDCVNTLREQWGLPALQRLPHAEEIRKMEEPEVAPKPNKKKPTEVKRKEKPDLSWLYKSSS